MLKTPIWALRSLTTRWVPGGKSATGPMTCVGMLLPWDRGEADSATAPPDCVISLAALCRTRREWRFLCGWGCGWASRDACLGKDRVRPLDLVGWALEFVGEVGGDEVGSQDGGVVRGLLRLPDTDRDEAAIADVRDVVGDKAGGGADDGE